MSHAAPSPKLRPFGPLLALVVAVLGGVGAAYLDLRARSDGLQERLDTLAATLERQTGALQLLRFEQRSKQGLGMPALLEQLEFWGPQFEVASTPTSQLPAIKEQCLAILEAMRHLGADAAMPALERAFFGAEDNDRYREWLMRAMADVAPARAVDLLARAARGLEFPIQSQLRLFAADHLVQIDKTRAAAVLRRILETETHTGIDYDRLSEDERRLYPRAREFVGARGRFYDFIGRYCAAGDPEAEQMLVRILGRRSQHDVLTLQETVKALGAMASDHSVDRIKDLFERPPLGSSPMFRNHCLDALVAIEGTNASEYLKKVLRSEKWEIVQNKIVALLKDTGS